MGVRSVEGILTRGVNPTVQADPGDGKPLDAIRTGVTEITTAGIETRTLPDPSFKGQEIDIIFVSDGGDCTVTATLPPFQKAGMGLNHPFPIVGTSQAGISDDGATRPSGLPWTFLRSRGRLSPTRGWSVHHSR